VSLIDGQIAIGSLFSGIGGLDLAVERATGGRVAWQCEKDPFCRSVLAKRWPGTVCHTDVEQLLDPSPVDVLCGGFPCQDISQAGKREGIDGSR
jgi:DNA (cytosine-5)-methyltransferase 1